MKKPHSTIAICRNIAARGEESIRVLCMRVSSVCFESMALNDSVLPSSALKIRRFLSFVAECVDNVFCSLV
jgi:hypothetical protein